MIKTNQFDYAKEILISSSYYKYPPAMLMLTYFYNCGIIAVNDIFYEETKIWGQTDDIVDGMHWFRQADNLDKSCFYSEALAYFLGYGIRYKHGLSMFRAGQLWIKLGLYEQALQSLSESVLLGYDPAVHFYENIKKLSESDIHEYVKNILPEAPLNNTKLRRTMICF